MSDLLIEALINEAGRLEVGIGSLSNCISCMKQAADLLSEAETIICETTSAAMEAYDELNHGDPYSRVEAMQILQDRIIEKPWIKKHGKVIYKKLY